MKIGCNYSEELKQLIVDKKIDIDYVKIPFENEEYINYEKSGLDKNVMLHGIPVKVYSKDLYKYDFTSFNNYLEKFRCPFFAVHFRIGRDEIDIDQSINKILEKAEQDLLYLKEKICKPLLIENMPYGITIKETVEPEYISYLCEKYDVFLLLDMSHAKISAMYLGMEFIDYINQLPLNKILEIHCNGTQNNEKSGIKDKHFEMQKEDYNNLKQVLSIIQPNYLTLEYGFFGKSMIFKPDKEAIIRQINNIKTLSQRSNYMEIKSNKYNN